MVVSFEENKENIRIYLLKIQTERKKTKLFGLQRRKAFRYLITERITYQKLHMQRIKSVIFVEQLEKNHL